MLVEYVAAVGSSYDRYVKFAQAQGWRPFSRGYFYIWVYRNKQAIETAREIQFAELRGQLMMNRLERIRVLEENARRLELIARDLLDAGDIDRALRVSEQLRRALETIARERGDREPEAVSIDRAHSTLLENMRRALLGAPQDAEQGEYREVSDAEAPVPGEKADL